VVKELHHHLLDAWGYIVKGRFGFGRMSKEGGWRRRKAVTLTKIGIYF
jgi:hypothetical protein